MRWYQGYRSSSWRVDETYVRVGGKWKYLFRAVDKQGRLIDFMLSDRRNTKAARRFLAKALKVMRNWPPVSITTDKLGSYPKALRRLKRTGELKDTVRHRTSKYLNNRIEADHGAGGWFSSSSDGHTCSRTIPEGCLSAGAKSPPTRGSKPSTG